MRYEDVVRAWDDYRMTMIAHQDEVALLLGHIGAALADALGLDGSRLRDIVRYIPVSKAEAWSKDVSYTPHGAIEFQHGGIVSAGMLLILELNENTFPKAPMLVPLEFQKPEDTFIVRTKSGSVEMQFSAEPTEWELAEFSRRITEAVASSWSRAFGEWRAGARRADVESNQPIGFK
jgi:hypothetical protein